MENTAGSFILTYSIDSMPTVYWVLSWSILDSSASEKDVIWLPMSGLHSIKETIIASKGVTAHVIQVRWRQIKLWLVR